MTTLLLLAATVMQSPALQTSLDRDPDRKAEWEMLLSSTPKGQKAAVEYLLENMPLNDLRGLPVTTIKEAVDLSYKARKALPWGKTVPQAVFLDSVVPYASVTEPRQSMRDVFQKRYLPLVTGTHTPGEAALIINKTLFKDYKVGYNTQRLRTDQSPPETISQGMATCTGLSIMLVDALRAVGVPSRLAGIPSWPGRGGNHTWVEVWDGGAWHFMGAAEPDAAGLDHAWFADEAAGAVEDQADNAIYAVTYHVGGARFPLIWDPGVTIRAENVTARYKRKIVAKAPRLLIDVSQHGQRVTADVSTVNLAGGDRGVLGKTLGPSADMNDFLAGNVVNGATYLVKAEHGGKVVTAVAKVDGDTVVHLDLDKETPIDVANLLADRFGSDGTKSAAAGLMLESIPCSPAAKPEAWNDFLGSPDPTLRSQFDAKTVATADRTSPYLWRTVGEKPKEGWGLVIAMHGGGNAPKEENDSEWHYMFDRYYRDHPEAGGYVYLALRAPNDTWNGFYDDAICPLVEKLILQFVKFQGVDPNRVYLCGASHGGYGAFVIGPKIPYRFAAIHPAASAQTDGETAGENLRNVHFTWAVGQNDNDYSRHDRAVAFQKEWNEWKAKYGGFDGEMEEVQGAGHIIGKHEEDQLVQLLKFSRERAPKRLVWTQTDNVLHRFYWLESLKPSNKGHVEAYVVGNIITLKTENQGHIALWLSSEWVDLKKPVTVIRDGKSQTFKVKPSLATYCDGLVQTGDPQLSGEVRLVVP